MSQLLPFGPGALLLIGAYLLSLLLIGWVGYRARQENSLKDFYLAGQGFGVIVLVLTLYATQYSGNTLFGFTGKTYRVGYSWVMSLHFMTAIIVCYLLFAPRLHWLAKKNGYVTPADYLYHRYRSKAIIILATLIMVVGLGNYLLAQLMAMGRAMQGLATVRPDEAYQYGVILLALIMVVYGTLGGLRAVAWTDVIQGAILMAGFAILVIMLFDQYGSLKTATERILNAEAADTFVKATPPDGNRCREWLSYVLLVGLGGALYPQAIQRIYAAKTAQTLRRSLAVMAFLPLTTTLVALIAGIMALAHIPGLEGAATDQVLSRVLSDIQRDSAFGYWLVVLLFAALLAALMSTADSALLSISSMLTKDLYARFLRPYAPQSELTRLGKIFSWLLIAALVALAILLRDKASLVALLDRKFDLLVQLAPAFMLGIHWRGLRAGPVAIGLIIGTAISLVLAFGDFDFVQAGKIGGIHPGLIGLITNLVIAVGGSLLSSRMGGELRALGRDRCLPRRAATERHIRENRH